MSKKTSKKVKRQHGTSASKKLLGGPKFCHICGKELVSSSPPTYNTGTGLAIKDSCPSGFCYHYGVSHSYEYGRFFAGYYARCTKCDFKITM